VLVKDFCTNESLILYLAYKDFFKEFLMLQSKAFQELHIIWLILIWWLVI